MTFAHPALVRPTGISVTAFLLAGAVLAQASAQQSEKGNLRHLPSPSAQQQESLQTASDRSRADADRRFREMDRRLGRTMRSVCVGC